jgi:hypothetical protein
MEDRLDLDHAVVGIATPDIAALLIISRCRLLAVALHERVLLAQLLKLGSRHEPGILEQDRLVRFRGDARDRTYLRIRHLATPEGIVDRREAGELTGHAYPLAGRDQIPADPPGQPVRTRLRSLAEPAAPYVEVAQIREEPMQGGIEMRGLFCDSLTQ